MLCLFFACVLQAVLCTKVIPQPGEGQIKGFSPGTELKMKNISKRIYFHYTCMKSFVIVKGVSLVELFLAELTGVLFHTIVHIHMVLEINKILIQDTIL